MSATVTVPHEDPKSWHLGHKYEIAHHPNLVQAQVGFESQVRRNWSKYGKELTHLKYHSDGIVSQITLVHGKPKTHCSA